MSASEEMSFENVDRRRTDRRHMPLYTISSTMSLMNQGFNETASYDWYVLHRRSSSKGILI